MRSEWQLLLDREAHRISAASNALQEMIRRGSRKRTRSRVATAVLALVVAGAGFVAAFGALRPSGRVGPLEGGAWTGIWPQQSLEQAQAAQAGADAGDPGYTWQLDAATVMQRYAQEQLGWGGFALLDIRTGGPDSSAPPGYNNESDLADPNASGPFRLIIMGCDSSSPGVSCPDATVTIERMLRRDKTGVWTVTKVEDQSVAVGASPTSSP